MPKIYIDFMYLKSNQIYQQDFILNAYLRRDKNLFIKYTSLTGVSTINRLFNTSFLIFKHKAKDRDTKE